jgi:hypothetical protein
MSTWAKMWTGPMFDNWRTEALPEDLVYAECNQTPTLTLKTVLYVNSGFAGSTEVSSLTMDTQDPSFTNRYHVAWATCD